MSDIASVLFGLDAFVVADVVRVDDRVVQVVIETSELEALCPGCGTLSGRVKGRPLVRIRDLPASGQRVELWWRERRLTCTETACPRRSFTQVTVEIPARPA